MAERLGDASDVQSQTAEPRLYQVLLLNDDFTPMDFVVLVLRRFFNKAEEEATSIMWNVHKSGRGIAGVFPLEIAEMKVLQVTQFAKANEHPLKCTLESV